MLDNINVLLIDDDTWMQKVLAKTISKLSISAIYGAMNGFEGINLAIETNPDIIFLDLLMPELNGITTLKILKSISLTKDIPVIIITANSDYEHLGAVLELGAAEFVAKPFTFATIQSKLVKVLEGSSNRKKNRIESIPQNAFSGLELEDDDIDFFNSLNVEIEGAKENKEDITKISSSYRKSYGNISQTYVANTSNEIKKILDS